jgi:hypothetical protein
MIQNESKQGKGSHTFLTEYSWQAVWKYDIVWTTGLDLAQRDSADKVSCRFPGFPLLKTSNLTPPERMTNTGT